MERNESLFAGETFNRTYLEARGFSIDTGARSGGIKSPLRVFIPPGSILLRTYQNEAGFPGNWWFTAAEMAQVITYFGRNGDAFSEGRSEGKGILQATLAVRHEWGGKSPNHMGLFGAIRTSVSLQALFGESDCAPALSQKSNLKPVLIIDRSGKQRYVRQIYLPECKSYSKSFSVIFRDINTDHSLVRLLQTLNCSELPFEAFN